MSLYGVMRTGVSGMNAQATRLSSVAENVANVNTTGYKHSTCEFSSLLLSTCPGNYEPGSVLTNIRNHVSTQGSVRDTTSSTDLAIVGTGFFVVADPSGSPVLTRAGSFVPDGDGNLVNAAGFSLMGYRLTPDLPGVTVNGFDRGGDGRQPSGHGVRGRSRCPAIPQSRRFRLHGEILADDL